MRNRTSKIIRGTFALSLLALSCSTFADQTTAEKIEAARQRAKEINEVKQVLADPDQAVRLAAFESMATSDDPVMRSMALDAGFASTDSLLRNTAFKYTVLGLEQIIITLIVDTKAPKEIQEKSTKYLNESGQSFKLDINTKKIDLGTGKFERPNNSGYTGNVNGSLLTFSYGSFQGELHLMEDNSLAGRISNPGWGYQFNATASVR